MDVKRFLDRLERMVNIDSGTTTVDGIEKVADILEEIYLGLGLTVKRMTFMPEYGSCLEVRNKPEDDDIDLLLIGHMDTVFPPGTAAARPFTIDGNTAYGPGVADMKSGDLLIAEIMEELLKEGTNLNIAIVHNCDEEYGTVSARDWLGDIARKSKYCLDFEPGRPDGSFVKARKGIAFIKVAIRGISAHAGIAPEKGASALLEMSEWISHFAKVFDMPQDATVNFGVVTGGTAYNVVPEHAKADVDVRFFSMDSRAKVLEEFRRLAEHPFDDRVKVTLDIQEFAPPMEVDKGSEHLMDIFRDEAEKLGQKAEFVATGGASDASYAAFLGASAIDACGPVGGNTHNDKEYMEIDSIEPRFLLMCSVIRALDRELAR